MSVDAALAALQAGRDAEALDLLLAQWRATPSAALADAIDAVGARIDPTRTRPVGKSARDKQASWHQLAEKGDPADVGVLLATLVDIARSNAIIGRIEKLAALPRDPRIAMKLALLVENWPISGSNGMSSVQRALDVIVAIADVRTIGVLQQIESRGDDYSARGHFLRSRERYLALLREATLYQGGPDIGPLRAWLAADAATNAAPITDDVALFAAVYANPEDDGPRLVLADALQVKGDPRGELIALQLAPPHGAGAKERRAREQELVKTYGRQWLGALEPAVAKHGLRYARGFLAKATVHEPGRSAIAQVLAAPQWATIEDLDTKWQEPAIRSGELMPALRWLRGVTNHIPSHPRLEHVELEGFDITDIERVVAPKLSSLAITATGLPPATLAAFWETHLGKQIEYFTIDALDRADWLGPLHARVMPRGRLRRAVISSRRNMAWRFTLEAGDVLRCDHMWTFAGPADSYDDLAEQLEALPPAMFARVELGSHHVLSPRLAAAIARVRR